MADPRITPAVLGWSNEDTHGGENVRLYAMDEGNSPRWDNSLGKGGRTVERVLVMRDGGRFEGDRYLVVHIGNRFVSAETQDAVTEAIRTALECHDRGDLR